MAETRPWATALGFYIGDAVETAEGRQGRLAAIAAPGDWRVRIDYPDGTSEYADDDRLTRIDPLPDESENRDDLMDALREIDRLLGQCGTYGLPDSHPLRAAALIAARYA